MRTMALYPLKFKPLLLEKIWGGRKFETVLGRTLPPNAQIGESWELYDFPPGVLNNSSDWISAEVANGPMAGRTLHSLVTEFGRQLHGDVPLVSPSGQFPILIKFLDAREHLSVQVHPDEAYAASNPGAHLKSEAWYVIQSDPGSVLFKGLRKGVTRHQFETACNNGTVEDLINAIPVKEGSCFYLPSGTVHALGKGILVAEVQTPSDTTFRVFDFNRIDASTGQRRTLHVNQAMQCINFGEEPPTSPRAHVGGIFTTVSQLVSCEHFKLEKVRFTEGVEEPIPYDEPVVWIMLEGQAQITVKGIKDPVPLSKGETVFLPAEMDTPIIKTKTDCIWLEATFPTKTS